MIIWKDSRSQNAKHITLQPTRVSYGPVSRSCWVITADPWKLPDWELHRRAHVIPKKSRSPWKSFLCKWHTPKFLVTISLLLGMCFPSTLIFDFFFYLKYLIAVGGHGLLLRCEALHCKVGKHTESITFHGLTSHVRDLHLSTSFQVASKGRLLAPQGCVRIEQCCLSHRILLRN